MICNAKWQPLYEEAKFGFSLVNRTQQRVRGLPTSMYIYGGTPSSRWGATPFPGLERDTPSSGQGDTPFPGLDKGYPIQLTGGYPLPGWDRGYPIQLRGYPHPGPGRGYPRVPLWQWYPPSKSLQLLLEVEKVTNL